MVERSLSVTSHYHANDHDDLRVSREWNENLSDLNDYVADSLHKSQEPAVINENLS